MKMLCFFVVALLSSSTIFAQSSGDSYAIKVLETEVRLWDDSKKNVDARNVEYRTTQGDIFTIVRARTAVIADKAVEGWEIEFWHFNADRTQQQQSLGFTKGMTPSIVFVDKAQNGKRFFISSADLKIVATTDFRRRHSWARIDAFIIPVKVRFKNNQPGGVSELTQSINVGPAVSYTKNYGGPFGKNSISLLFAVNATNVSVDEKTVPGIVTGKTTLLGLSPTAGINWQYDKINFGIFTGIDVLFGDAMDKWAYRKSPWVGLSFGTSITDLTSPKKENQ
ncbi:hypothetical protein [Mucilaginibacter sp. CSA2-8R]|uniref:hypothetical protein n=1 Tax=Mucilaginibacter sp. CSA2-8R TaxID=3141542 RepID=UPI00315C4C68